MDTVVIRGVNDDEMVDLLEFARARGAELRFIEYMDVGGATHWTRTQVVPRSEMLDRLAAHYGPITPLIETSSAPADRFRLPDGHGLRHHRVDDRAILRGLRSQPADGGWTLVPVPVCGSRHRSAWPAPWRRRPRFDEGTGHRRLACPDGPRRRAPARHARAVAADSGHGAQARPPPGDAHARRVNRCPPLLFDRTAGRTERRGPSVRVGTTGRRLRSAVGVATAP